jgi:hypothetical protein
METTASSARMLRRCFEAPACVLRRDSVVLKNTCTSISHRADCRFGTRMAVVFKNSCATDSRGNLWCSINSCATEFASPGCRFGLRMAVAAAPAGRPRGVDREEDRCQTRFLNSVIRTSRACRWNANRGSFVACVSARATTPRAPEGVRSSLWCSKILARPIRAYRLSIRTPNGG